MLCYGIKSVVQSVKLIDITVLSESYVEGTTFSGGLPPYVPNRLV